MLRNFSLLLLAVIALSGCGKKGCFAPTTLQSFGSLTDASDIPLDGSIPSDQQDTIRKDFARLGTLNLSTSEEDKCVLGIKDFTGSTLVQYLKTRVRYVVGETFEYEKANVIARSESGDNPFIYSAKLARPSQLSEVVTVMTNIGAFIYLVGKKNNETYALDIANRSIVIKSPRDGVVQIGKGMFSANQVPGSARDSVVNSLLRLAVMFHEARHSDGHGNHAAFPHTVCDSGEYEGNSACEDNSNGPYAVQATLTKKFIEGCVGCSTKEINGMLRLQADYESRLEPDAIARDDRPEGFWK